MATKATCIAVSVTGAKTNLMSTSIENTKRKTQENLISTRKNQQPVQSLSSSCQQSSMMSAHETKTNYDGIGANGFIMSNTSTFRIPKIERLIDEMPSSIQVQQLTVNGQSNDDIRCQQGKRKFSLSQYKEHKRLKSDETIQNPLADIDMRINMKESSPTTTSDESAMIFENSSQRINRNVQQFSKVSTTKSILSEPGAKKLIKKKVIWADDKRQALVKTSFFEIDDSERAHIHVFAHHYANEMSIAQLEKLLERDIRQQQNSQDNDDGQNLPSLPPLIRILLPNTIQSPTIKSHQRVVQEEREKTVLKALSIRSFRPERPGEPDDVASDNSTTELKLIPLDNDTSADEVPLVDSSTPTVTDATSITIPTLPSFSSDNVSPQVAQILAAAKGNLTSVTNTTPVIHPSPPITTPVNSMFPFGTAPNILSILLNGMKNNNVSSLNPMPNLPLNFNLPPPQTYSPMNQLLTNVFALGLPSMNTHQPSPPTTVFNTSAQFSSTTENTPSAYVDTASNQRAFRFHDTNHNERPISNNRGRDHHHHHQRRGSNNTNRRNYYSNRNGFS